MAKIEKFEDLIVWQKSRELTKIIYQRTSDGRFSKDFALRDQIRRSSISVASNIAEGFGRNGNKEFIQYLSMANGSLCEMRTQSYIAKDLEYITNSDLKEINDLCDEIGRLISGLVNYLQKSELKGSKYKSTKN
jgi:four helix bundle protein